MVGGFEQKQTKGTKRGILSLLPWFSSVDFRTRSTVGRRFVSCVSRLHFWRSDPAGDLFGLALQLLFQLEDLVVEVADHGQVVLERQLAQRMVFGGD